MSGKKELILDGDQKRIHVYDGQWLAVDQVIELFSPLISLQRHQTITESLNRRISGVRLLCERIYDPGNMGALIRSADVFGLSQCYTSGEILQKTSSRSAKSSNAWVAQSHFSSSKDCIAKLKDEGFLVLGTHLGTSSIHYDQIKTSQKVLIVMGNEGSGMLDETLSLCHQNIVIPSFGMTQSLNLSAAGAILLSYFSTMYRTQNNVLGDLTDLEKRYYLAYYLSNQIEFRVKKGIIDRYLN